MEGYAWNRSGGENRLNLVIAEQFDTEIVLEAVAKRENDFYIQLNIIPHPNRISGQLLSTSLIMDGTSTLTGDSIRWQVIDDTGTDLLGGRFGTGDGPGNISVLFIEDTYRDKLAQGAHVRFSGYYLYGYRQLPWEYGPLWRVIFYSLIIVAGIVVLYRKRTEQEKGAAWKLVGYVLLGGFTFSLNHIRLPLGFVVYWLFFRKSNTNRSIKHKAALLGLLMYVLQLVMPGIAGVLDSKVRNSEIQHISIEQLGIEGLLKMIAARSLVGRQAKVEYYESVVSREGKITDLRIHLVDLDDQGRYIHTDAFYKESEQSVALERYLTDEWAQFPRQVLAMDFFEKVQSLKLTDLKPSGGDYRNVRLELREYGSLVNYAIKDTLTFGIDEDGIYEIKDEQMPVQGIWITACGIPPFMEPFRDCENNTNYLFDIVGGTLRYDESERSNEQVTENAAANDFALSRNDTFIHLKSWDYEADLEELFGTPNSQEVVGNAVGEVKKAYPGIEIALDGRTDPNNCAYVVKDEEQNNYLQFEVTEGLVSGMKIYHLIP